MRSVKLGVEGDLLRVTPPKAPAVAIHAGDVRHAWMYKHDDITSDLICCELEVGRLDGPVTYTLHEELPGWRDFLAWLEALPGFNRDWREAVVHPPFQENRTLVYQAANQAY